MPRRVTLFSTDSCTFCVHAKSLLRKRCGAFEEVDLGEHPQLQEELASRHRPDELPQILVDLELLGGLNELPAPEKDGTLASWIAD